VSASKRGGASELSPSDVLDQFGRAMRAAGLETPDEIIADGKLHRVRIAGDKAGARNGWYVLHGDGLPAGEFGSWRSGQRETWRADIGRTLTQAEERAHRARVDAIRKARKDDEAAQHRATAARAAELWKIGREMVRADHPYLVAKRVRAYGIRQTKERLIVPVRRGGDLVGLQFIGPDGSKKFLTGTPKAGAYHVIGAIEADAPELAIAEGYATAATLHALSGWPVLVAFDAGNLLPVAKAARKAFPQACIVIAADDDRATPGNPGRTKAEAAAAAVAGIVCAPPLTDNMSGSDWNDLAEAIGDDAAGEALRQALEVAKGEPVQPMPVRAPLAPATHGERPEATADKGSNDEPADGPLSPRYELRTDGLFWCDVEFDGKGRARPQPPLFLCSSLKIEALTRDMQGRGWGRLVSFTDADGIGKTTIITARLFGTSRSDELRGALLDAGLPIIASSPKAQRQLNDYLMRETPEVRARCVTRTGWHGSSFVLPSQTFGPVDGERFYLADDAGGASAYERCGRFDLWRDLVARPCGEHRRALFAMACSFAGPLLDLAGAESGGFHLVGGSSSGKTTALRLAASVWGSPDTYWRQWRSTDNGLEAIAEEFNDTLLALDEIGQADPKIIGEVSYMLANGRGKQRARKEGGARAIKSWRVLLLSTGEVGTSGLMNSAGQKTRAGHEVRLCELPADAGRGFGLFDSTGGKASPRELATMLVDTARTHYGHAGPEFVARLADRRADIAREARDCVAQFVKDVAPQGADGQVLRVAARFGLVAYAGELATEWKLTGWDFEAVGSACRHAFASWLERRGTAGAKEPASMVAQVRAYIEEHGGAGCQDLTDFKRSQGRSESARYGMRDDPDPDLDPLAAANEMERKTIYRIGYRWREAAGRTIYAIYPEAFKNKLCNGYEHTEVCKALAAARVLIRTDGEADRYTKKTRIPQHKNPVPFYQLDGDVLMGADA